MKLHELLAQIGALDPAAFCDADKSLRVLAPTVARVNPGKQMLGIARTVRCYDDFLSVIQALDESSPGEVLVIDTQGTKRAVVGELFSIEAERRGLAGIVIDGGCRDTETLRTLNLPVYASHRTPVSGTVQKLYETQVPIICGGVEIMPGDILFADSDGVIALSEEQAISVLDAAKAIKATEQKAIALMASGSSLIELTNYREHTKALKDGKTSRLSFKVQ